MADLLYNDKAIDIHTHVVSLDPASGCYLSPTLRRRPLFQLFKWQYGLDRRENWQVENGRLQATVIAAHGVGAELFHEGHFDSFVEILFSYPNFYTDTSALSLPHRKRYLLKLLKHTEVHHKLIHGSDFPLPSNAWSFLGDLPLSKILKINRILNPIRRDFMIKKELGFPKEVFTRAGEIIARSAKAC